jgi:hypothetical protein
MGRAERYPTILRNGAFELSVCLCPWKIPVCQHPERSLAYTFRFDSQTLNT